MLGNLGVAELRHNWRQEYLEAERRAAANIREQRSRAGMSQEQLATALKMYGFDLHQSTIAKIEAGKRPLRLAELFAFADALSIPWMNLIEGGRDIDIFPDEGMVPVDLWQAQLEELVHEREDVMSDLVSTFEAKARAYAEYDRAILVRISALNNAAARAQRDSEGQGQVIREMLERWQHETSKAKAAREHSLRAQQSARAVEEQEARAVRQQQQSALIDEFLRWRDGQASNPSE